jgi:hypothetical protein
MQWSQGQSPVQRVVRAAAVVDGNTDWMSVTLQDLMKELFGRAFSTMSDPMPSISRKIVVLLPPPIAFARSCEVSVAGTGVGSPVRPSSAWIRSVKFVCP